MKPTAASRQYGGAWPVLVTPFNTDKNIDTGILKELVRWYVSMGVGGVYANCLSSEMYALTTDERLSLVAAVIDAAAGKVPVMATGNLADTVTGQIKFCRALRDIGVDITGLIIPPALESEGAIDQYFLDMADNLEGDLGIYECPVPCRCNLTAQQVRRIANTGRYKAMKETSCDLESIRAKTKSAQGTVLGVFQANIPYLPDALRVGAPGTMSLATNLFPEVAAALVESVAESGPRTNRLHSFLCEVDLLIRSNHPRTTKYCLGLRGIPVSDVCRINVPELSPETRVGLEKVCGKLMKELAMLL